MVNVMPIRIRSGAKLIWETEIVDSTWFLRNYEKMLQGCYTDRKSQIWLFRGSA
jgi:hypothetical protein